MANLATTTYKVTGSHKAVSDLWTAFQSMNVNTQNIWLDELAKYYGIDYEAKHISVRGHIYFAEYEEDNGRALLSFESETAWDACNELFEEINHKLGDRLSISYRVSSLKRLAFLHTENHLMMSVMIFITRYLMQSGNGAPRWGLSEENEPKRR